MANTFSVIVLIFLGIVVGYLVRMFISLLKTQSAEKRADEIVRDAKTKAQEFELKAKEKAIALIDETKREESIRRRELKIMEEKFEKRQNLFDRKLLEIENEKKDVAEEQLAIVKLKEKLKQSYDEISSLLEKIAQLSKEDAKKILLENIEQQYQDALWERIKKLERYNSDELEKKTRALMITAMERFGGSVAQERNTSIVTIPSDDIKGKIIGKEGRNIKTIEQLTGAEIIVDDTPSSVLVSCFSPIRRELAKRTLEKLIVDGRIQPARIERTFEEVKEELAKEVKAAGEDALHEVGITGLDTKIVQLLGRLKFRTSYGQNVLQHSIEATHIAGILAKELGCNVRIAKTSTLLHDIGKALDHEVEGTHIELAKEVGEKYGLPQEIITAIIDHHEDHPQTPEGVIVKVADALSGARPGARRDSYEAYVKRLEDLETIAKNYQGVAKVFAIEAGRELRIFVKPEEIDDLAAHALAKKIAEQIQHELKYPGEIRVTVIREKRVVEIAK
ncbi:MAG: ribonuclease Y [Parcubacteria group bacterium]|nr:ribonuclease Y [Parcubacteria group bacterium]